jgi:cytidine deaminase
LTDAPQGTPLDPADEELVAAARAVIIRLHRPFWHTVAAAIRSQDGLIWTGVHLGATVGRLAVCAEPIAVGRAILEGDGTVVTAVAVRHRKPEEGPGAPDIVSPCGACRELLMDYAPDAMVIVPGPAGVEKRPVRVMLPLPYRR